MTSFVPADRLRGMKDSIWIELKEIALLHKPVDLGPGFPDFSAPKFALEALSNATLSENVLLNQYTRSSGHPRLVNALSKLYEKLIGRSVNPQKEILVTVGAYEALYASVLSLVNPGDEVILIEPYYDCYEPITRLAGAVPVYIPLRPTKTGNAIFSSEWTLDPTELRSKFNNKTKVIIVNTPHNPLGKVFKREELQMIADLCQKYDVIAVMDEVYQWMVYEGCEHVRMATLPDMWERTISIGSAGKTFNLTGWKIGWAYGPEHLIKALQLQHQHSVYSCPTPIQEAVAVMLEIETERFGQPNSYWNELVDMLEKKKNRIVKFLTSVGMNPIIPEGGCAIIADFSEIGSKVDFDDEEQGTNDYKFVKWLARKKKLLGLPPSMFYSNANKHLAQNLIRFCYMKEDSTLDKVEAIINDLKNL